MRRNYVIDGIPRSGKNSQRILRNPRTGGRFVIKSKAASAWLKSAEAQLLEQGAHKQRIIGAVRVSLVAYQKSDVCDVDNIASLVMDSLKNLAIGDDADVIELRARKDIDRARPRVEITVEAA